MYEVVDVPRVDPMKDVYPTSPSIQVFRFVLPREVGLEPRRNSMRVVGLELRIEFRTDTHETSHFIRVCAAFDIRDDVRQHCPTAFACSIEYPNHFRQRQRY